MKTMLTKRQKELLSIIYKYIKNSGYPPSFEEMREELGVASNQSIIDHLKALEQKRFIKRSEAAARGIKILKKSFEMLKKPILVPLLGTSSAGYGLEAIETKGEWQTLSKEVAQFKGDLFLVKITGDSMIRAGIKDGDVVLVKESKEFSSGDIVLARNNGDTTVKRFISIGGLTYLKPENSNYKNIPFTEETEIIGKVITVLNQAKRKVTPKKQEPPSIPGLFHDTLVDRKRILLNKLRSPSDKTKYKRYLGTPLRYAGGKTLAVGHIVNLLPDNTKRVVSPFLGGASVEIAIAKELGIPVIGYDIFDILINYWHYQINEPEKLAKKLEKFKPTKEEYARVREIMKKHWKKEKKLEGLNLASVYYFNHNTSYGPHFLGSQSSVYLQPDRYKKTIEKVKKFDVKKLKVFCDSFEKVIPKYKNDLLYCDPPYYLDGDSKMFIGMYPHRNFPIHHKGFNHEKLRELLKNHKGGFILSYNDCSTIREWYKDFNIITPSWQYTFSQGDTRIGKNRKNNNNGSHIKKSHEIIIWKHPN